MFEQRWRTAEPIDFLPRLPFRNQRQLAHRERVVANCPTKGLEFRAVQGPVFYYFNSPSATVGSGDAPPKRVNLPFLPGLR